MTRQAFPLFEASFVDYRGCLRRVDVSFYVGDDRKLYFECAVDEIEAYSIRLGEDGSWYERCVGPTVIADELGSVIESNLF